MFNVYARMHALNCNLEEQDPCDYSWQLSFFFKRMACHFLYPGVNCAWKRRGKPRGAQRNNPLLRRKRSFHENCHKHFEMSMGTWGVLQLQYLHSRLNQNETKEKENQMHKNLTTKTFSFFFSFRCDNPFHEKCRHLIWASLDQW